MDADAQLLYQWDIMESLQATYPHLWLGWNGYVPMVVWG